MADGAILKFTMIKDVNFF